MTQLVYLLHFDQPLSHAQHYLGSTARLYARLTEHAGGNGARLTQVLHEQHRGWIVAALFQPTDPTKTIRQLETETKRRHNSTKFCPICNPNATAPKGLISIPLPTIHSNDLKDQST